MKNTRFVVYGRISGGMYIALRKTRKSVTEPKYTWCKDRSRAVRLTAEVALKVATRYGGLVKSI